MKKIPATRIFSHALLGILLLLTLFPFYLMLVNSVKWHADIVMSPWFFQAQFHFTNYSKAFGQIIGALFNSIFVTVAVIALTIVLSMLAAYAFARFTFRGSGILYFGIIALLMIPGFVLLIPQFIQMKNLRLLNTFSALIFTPTAYSVAMGTFLARTSIEGIPKSLFEAADIEGAREMHILLRIVTPLSTPIISTIAIITGLSAWNNYIWPLVVTSGSKVMQITVALANLKGSIREGTGLLLAGYVISSLPVILLFSFASKYFIAGLTQGSVKG